MSHQLIQVEATGKVSTIALTLGQISTETAKIKTVCIVGPTRTGKSFLLNCLANKENLFKVENGGCVTKGANISKIPVLIEKTPTYLIDVEGMGDKSEDYDYQLCLPVLATVDVVLLNIRGQSGKHELLNFLNRFVFMYNKVFKQDNKLGQFLLPHLVLIMRDWTNRPGYEKQYLSNLLTEENSADSMTQNHNHIRRGIKSCFQSIEMITTPIPTTQEILEATEELSFQQLSSKFAEKVREIKKLLSCKFNDPIKTIFGNKLGTAAQLAVTVRNLTNEVNNAEFRLPNVLEAMNAYYSKEIEKHMRNWTTKECRLPEIPQNPQNLRDVLNHRFQKIKDEFLDKSAGLNLGTNHETEFLQSLARLHRALEDKNKEEIKSIVQKVYIEFLDRKPTIDPALFTWEKQYGGDVEKALMKIGVSLKFSDVCDNFSEVKGWLEAIKSKEAHEKEIKIKAEENEKLRAQLQKLEIGKAEEEGRRKEAERLTSSYAGSSYGGFSGYSPSFSYSPSPSSSSSTSRVSSRNDPCTGFTPTGLQMFTGPRGGVYHISSSGNKQYHSKK